jgi:hypothetical protein
MLFYLLEVKKIKLGSEGGSVATFVVGRDLFSSTIPCLFSCVKRNKNNWREKDPFFLVRNDFCYNCSYNMRKCYQALGQGCGWILPYTGASQMT